MIKNYINLGAGVQSSVMALMCAKGEIKPRVEACLFADTKAETNEVYDWLKWLEGELPFPVIRVSFGDLTKDSLTPAIATKQAKTKKEGEEYMKRIIPMFGLMPNGEKTAVIGRSCTADYKIRPIQKKIRELANIKRGEKEIKVNQWMGISYDEIQRMKESRFAWSKLRYPLIELKRTRQDWFKWMDKNNYPRPPRSACYYCPFHSNDEWRNLRNNNPKYFKKAIQFEKEFQKVAEADSALKMKPFLHRSCNSLDEINFDNDIDKGQEVWDFSAECEGLCGT